MTWLPDKSQAGDTKTRMAGKYLHARVVQPKLIGRINDYYLSYQHPVINNEKSVIRKSKGYHISKSSVQ